MTFLGHSECCSSRRTPCTTTLDSPSVGLDALACYLGFDDDDVEVELGMCMRKARRGSSEVSGGSSLVPMGRMNLRNWVYLVPRDDSSDLHNQSRRGLYRQRCNLSWCRILPPGEILWE